MCPFGEASTAFDNLAIRLRDEPVYLMFTPRQRTCAAYLLYNKESCHNGRERVSNRMQEYVLVQWHTPKLRCDAALVEGMVVASSRP